MKSLHLLFIAVAGISFTTSAWALTYDYGGGSSRGYRSSASTRTPGDPMVIQSATPVYTSPMRSHSPETSIHQLRMNQSRAARYDRQYGEVEVQVDTGQTLLGEPPCPPVRMRRGPPPCTPGNGCNSIKYPW